MLTDAELLFLAAIPNNPSMYDPLKNYNATKQRQERMVKQLVQQNKLTKEKSQIIVNELITLTLGSKIDLFPDYVTYVERELQLLVAQQEGLLASLKSNDSSVRTNAEKEVKENVKKLLMSGVTIHTALNSSLQNHAQKTLQNFIPYSDIEGATVVIQHNTHELVSLTGAKDYKKYSFHRGFQSFRQPGSAIKPLLVYAPYIDINNASINQSIDSSSFCKNGYCPKNYGGATYGNVTIKKAFAHSYNTPAVRIFNDNGITNSFAYLDMFNFTKLVKSDYHLPAAVGGFTYGMSPLELTDAYTSFYNGSYQPARAIRKITDQKEIFYINGRNSPYKFGKITL